jgi:hypothetical protein
MYVYVRVCTCMYVYVRVCTCMYVYVRVCMCMCMCRVAPHGRWPVVRFANGTVLTLYPESWLIELQVCIYGCMSVWVYNMYLWVYECMGVLYVSMGVWVNYMYLWVYGCTRACLLLSACNCH